MNPVNVLVMAPILGEDTSFIAEVDPRLHVMDGNAAYVAELEAQGLRSLNAEGGEGAGPPQEERDALFARADVICMAHPVLKDIASRAPRLSWVHHTQAGASNLWASDLWGSGVMLTTSRGRVAPTSIAQYAIAGTLYFGRGLFDASLDKRDGEINRARYRVSEVGATTIGIVGLGGIGREVARLARSLSMRVLATRRSVQSRQTDADGVDLVLPADGLEEMAAESDFLVVCTQLTEETRDMIDARVLAGMKPGAVLVNVARGEVVDEDALVEALQNGVIRGAVLDVYRGELEGLPPRRELMDLPQVLLTSHASPRGTDFTALVRGLFADNLRRFLDGRPLLNVVDRSVGY